MFISPFSIFPNNINRPHVTMVTKYTPVRE